MQDATTGLGATGPLADLLRQHGLIDTLDLQVQRLAGGQSNPTFRLTCGSRRFVLRKKPPGELLASAHAIEREARVIEALQTTAVPVPKVYLSSDDASIVGTPFYVMEYLDGRVWMDPALPELATSQRAAVYEEMNRVIAALHEVDHIAIGLGDFGKTGGYFARQIARWTRQVEGSRTVENRALDALMEWLPGRVPPDDRTTLVHGDYRLDNLVFHPTEVRAIGVLDWELSTLGHPLADFSYNCLSWHIPPSLWRGIAGLNVAALGLPQERSYVERYCRATSSTQALEHWDYYIAYNLFRLAAIMQGIARRVVDGSAVAADALHTGSLALPMAELGWQYAQRYEAARA